MEKIFLLIIPGVLWAMERGVTVGFPILRAGGVKRARVVEPLEESSSSLSIPFRGETWQIIPAGSSSVVKFNSTQERLEVIPLRAGINSDSVFLAIKSAPVWLQPELFDGIRRLPPAYQLIYARKILTSDPKYRDEIAFQIAHLAPKTLERIDPAILDTNVVQLYRVDPDLKFVDIVEYGDPTTGDWYTTTKYKVINKGGDTTWIEIPKEIYYWYVMMPKLSDEEPRMDYSVFNKFWRDYLYNYSDPGYPLLKDVLKDIEVFWDGEYHVWSADRGVSDTMMAVDAIGWWVSRTVPNDVQGPRYIQPNQIAHCHYGRCGEGQDLLNAAARTALLPVLSLHMWAQDHVWNGIYWDGEFYEYQVDNFGGPTHIRDSTTSYDSHDRQTGVVFANRADWYTWSLTYQYTPTCTLTVRVRDRNGNPVDGAELMLMTPYVWEPSALYYSHWAYTDRDGEYTVVVGDSQSYYLRVDCPLGSEPSSPTQFQKVLDSLQTVAGKHFEVTYDLPGELSMLSILKKSSPTDGPYKLRIYYNIPYRVVYGHKYWKYTRFGIDSYEFGDFRSPGDIDFFICDGDNYNRYRSGLEFEAYEIREHSPFDSLEFILPDKRDFYVVFSNDERMTISQLLCASISLYKKTETGWVLIDSCSPSFGIEEEPEEIVLPSLKISPNPLRRPPLHISYTLDKDLNRVKLVLYDITGRRVRTLLKGKGEAGTHRLLWNGRDEKGRRVSAGIYFLRLTTPEYERIRKIVLLR